MATPDMASMLHACRDHHNPLRIRISDPQIAYSSGETIKGYIVPSVPVESIESIEVFLVGTTQTEVYGTKHNPDTPNRTAVCTRDKLIDLMVLAASPKKYSNGRWPFEFTVPRLTDTPGKYGPSWTPLEFAIQRHRLPPTYFDWDSFGNKARVDYGICAHLTHTDPNLNPHELWLTLRLDTWEEKQEIPPAARYDLKAIVFNNSSVSFSPAIFIPIKIIPGRQFPLTIELTPGLHNSSLVELISLRVAIKETTRILGCGGRLHRIGAWFGSSFILAKREVIIEDTSVPAILDREPTSILRRMYTVEQFMQPDIKTFSISVCHLISVNASFSSENGVFDLDMTIPIRILSRRR